MKNINIKTAEQILRQEQEIFNQENNCIENNSTDEEWIEALKDKAMQGVIRAMEAYADQQVAIAVENVQFRNSDYFNEEDLYLFEGTNIFLSKVIIENSNNSLRVFTINHPKRMQYKATTVKCINLKELK